MAAGARAGTGTERAAPAHLSRALLPTLVLLSAIAYGLTANRRVLGGDNGEFSALYAAGGIAHPPGYPAMVLWLRLWHWLPVGSPTHGAALATAILGVLSVVALQRACLAWGASYAATAFASAVYAFSPMAWKMSSHAEVFAMNALFAAAVLWIASPEPRLRGSRMTAALGLLAGVAVSNHQTIVTLAPVGLLAALRAVRLAKRPSVAAGAGVGAFILGVALPYAYVYVVARTASPETTPMWIEAPSLSGVLFHLRRGAYGTFTLTATAGARHTLGHLSLFAEGCTRHLLGLPLLVLGAGAVAFARGRLEWPWSAVVRARLSLVAAFLLAGPLFVSAFNLPTSGLGPTIAERFYLLPELIVALLGALSIDALLPRLVARDTLVAAMSAQAGVAATFLTLPEVLEHNRPTVEMYVENTLRTAPPGAILVGSGDHRWGGFLYARYALHLRPDVAFVMPGILVQAWYRREVERTTGASAETPAHGPVGPRTLMARLLATGRPLFYTDWPDADSANTPHDTLGTLMHVPSAGEARPTLEDLEARNEEVFSRYEVEDPPPDDPHGWGYSLQLAYARAWTELADAYAAAGRRDKQQACFARAARFAPWIFERSAVPEGARP